MNKVLSFDMGCGEPVAWVDNGEYHELSLEEAIKKYGEIKSVERGPRGGFKSITIGNKLFLSKLHGIS